MIKNIVLLLMIVSSSVQAGGIQDEYDLLDFIKNPIPASIYQSISLIVNDNKKYVQTCGKKSLFTKTLNKNSKKDSLRIENEFGEQFIISKKKLIALNSHYRLTPYLKSIFKIYLGVRNRSRSLQKLLSKIEEMEHITVIRPNKGANNSARILPTSKNKACSNIDASMVTFFDGKKAFENLLESCLSRQELGSASVVNWAPHASRQTAFNQISLAHELYHAYDITRGLLDHRFVMHKKLQRTEVREYRAVYFENQVRKELGYALRHQYGSNPGVMVINNEPVWIQRPCIGKNSSHKRSITLL